MENQQENPSTTDEKKWLTYLKKIGFWGIVFFTVKGTITLFFGGYLLNLLCN